MKRFVTYIYEYERGVKGKNTGFIKADIRGNDCRMEIHLRGLNGIRGKGKVYVLVKEENLMGIELGEIMLSGGKGDFRTVFRVSPIQNTSYSFQDIVGVCAVYGGGQLSASQWRGEEPISFTVSDIQIREKPQAKPVEEGARSELVSVSETDARQQLTGREATEKAEQQASDGRAAEEAEQQASDRGAAVQAEKALLPRNKEDMQMTEAVSDPVLEAHAAAHAQNIFPDNASLASKWEELQPNHQALGLASENQGSWIRMEIKELRELPKRFWYLGNNSFLLHGFFNYQHIIFGKEEMEQGTMWYLGVPGVFHKEERVMATLFGFSRFCPLTGKASEGSFGYWMHTLERS